MRPTQYLEHRFSILLLVATIAAAAYMISFNSRVDYSGYDPRGTLLVSQSLIDHGTIRLDEYASQSSGFGYRIHESDGHLYYFFPVGTSLASVPAVWVARSLGYDMLRGGDEALVQRVLSAFLCAVCFLLLFLIAELYVGSAAALLLAAIFFFGSSLISTMGTALWSSDLTIVLLLASMLLVLRWEVRGVVLRPLILALLLSFAWACRPTAAIACVLIALYVGRLSLRDMMLLGAAGITLFAIFVLWSHYEFGTLLPEYYQPHRIEGIARPGNAFLGYLISPSRGILVSSPFLLLLPVLLLRNWRSIHKPLIILGTIWFVLHLIVVCRFPNWWGGHSYGPRLLADALPALFLVSLPIVRSSLGGDSGGPRMGWLIPILLLSSFGVFVNSGQGLYNRSTQEWSRYPDIDHDPSRLFDWSQPQFLATRERIGRRRRRMESPSLDPIHIDHLYEAADPHLYLENWYGAEVASDGRRYQWSDGTDCRIGFQLDPSELEAVGDSLWIRLDLGAAGAQRIGIELNHHPLETVKAEGFWPSVFRFRISKEFLIGPGPGEAPSQATLNSIHICVPDAVRGRHRAIGIGLWALTLGE